MQSKKMVLSALDLNMLLHGSECHRSTKGKAERKLSAKAVKRTRTMHAISKCAVSPSVLNRARCWALECQEHASKLEQEGQRKAVKSRQVKHKQQHGQQALQSAQCAPASASALAGTRAPLSAIEGMPIRSSMSVHDRRRMVFAQLGLSRGQGRRQGPGVQAHPARDTTNNANAFSCSSSANQDVDCAAERTDTCAETYKDANCASRGAMIDVQWGSDCCDMVPWGGTEMMQVSKSATEPPTAQLQPVAQQTSVKGVSRRLDDLNAQHTRCSTAVDDSILSLTEMFRVKGNACCDDEETEYVRASSMSRANEQNDKKTQQHTSTHAPGRHRHGGLSRPPPRLRCGAGMVLHNNPRRAPTYARQQLQHGKCRTHRIQRLRDSLEHRQKHPQRGSSSSSSVVRTARRVRAHATSIPRKCNRSGSTSKRGWVQRAMLTDAMMACNDVVGKQQKKVAPLTLSERLAMEQMRAVTSSKR